MNFGLQFEDVPLFESSQLSLSLSAGHTSPSSTTSLHTNEINIQSQPALTNHSGLVPKNRPKNIFLIFMILHPQIIAECLNNILSKFHDN